MSAPTKANHVICCFRYMSGQQDSLKSPPTLSSISLAWRVFRACLSSSVLVGEGFEVSQVPASTLHSGVETDMRSSVAHDGNGNTVL